MTKIKIKLLMMAPCLLLAQMAVAQTCNDAIPASTPDSRFIVNGNEVTDTVTGLIWQSCSLGQTGSDCSGGSASGYTWKEALEAASPPWRLPNINELNSIVEEKCSYPAINLTVFPNTPSSNYWLASPDAYISDSAWYVGFGYGYSSNHNKSDNLQVRLVRGGQ